MSLFTRRVEFKPFEYPDLTEYKEAIQHSYWLISEWNFVSDIQDFHVRLTPEEKEAIRRTLLAISQIEVSIKRFWGKIGDRFPKSEIESVGAVFAESEVRHADAYSHLLQVLGLNSDFSDLVENPLIARRLEYLKKYMGEQISDQEYALALALFTICMEGVSLFSQFLIVKSFSSHRNMLKDVDNVVQATMREEEVHKLFGIALINHLRNEFPSWFDEVFYLKLDEVVHKAYNAECDIVDWIFEKGELDFLPKEVVKSFICHRLNEGVVAMGGVAPFYVDPDHLEQLDWFTTEFYGDVSTDFFYKKSTNYSKRVKSITGDDLFG